MVQKQIIRATSHASEIQSVLKSLAQQSYEQLLWCKDPRPWNQDAQGAEVIRQRLGWLDSVPKMIEQADEFINFADTVRNAGFKDVVLMGMGGSSLSAEVSKLTFGGVQGYPRLHILDTTIPQSVLAVEHEVDLGTTLFIASSKSGTTVEVLSAMKYFLSKVEEVIGRNSGRNFVCITDPGTPLEEQARSLGFRRIFAGMPDVGGRYSALTPFGLVPAAVIGVDIRRMLASAADMMEACGPNVRPEDNPAMELGAVMASLARSGRDKLTLILSPEISSFGSWIEQLVAESTGKHGLGILPVDGEPIGDPCVYGEDRFFVYVKVGARSVWDEQVATLERHGFPVVTIIMDDIYDLGAEYYRWMMATATACAVLGINPFDQPNVQESKDNTKQLIKDYEQKGCLPEVQPVVECSGIKVYCNEFSTAGAGDELVSNPDDQTLLSEYLRAHLMRFKKGGYFALLAFLPPLPQVDAALEQIRVILRDKYFAVCTKGYGPRFLHSTGQYHKGGPRNGVFIQLTADSEEDAPIPGEKYTWAILSASQALGDFRALASKSNPILRLHLGSDVVGGLQIVVDAVRRAAKDKHRE